LRNRDPDKNVIPLFDITENIKRDVLVEVAHGRLDLNAVALKELKNKVLDKNGKWVGFNQ
jgi:hypothetical protein